MIGKNIENIYYTDPTEDGWRLIMKRYRPVTQTTAVHPVVLCHGFAANKYSCDFGDEGTSEWQKYSLAAYLSQGCTQNIGFDVWVPELRGRNGSQTFSPEKNPEKYSFCLDEYVDQDIPRIITKIFQVYEQEGHNISQVLWVGKSMGGMLAYAFGIIGNGNKLFRGVVTIGSPVRFRHSPDFLRIISRLSPRKVVGPIDILAKINWDNFIVQQLKESMADKKHIEKKILDTYFKYGFTDALSLKVVNHFGICARRNTFCRYPKYPWMWDLFHKSNRLKSYVKPFCYSEHLNEFTVPLLVIAGGGDKLGNPLDVAYAFHHVGSVDKQYVLFSKDKDYSSYDYGHLDLNLGKKASEEIYPKIYTWLLDHTKIRN